MDVKFMWGNSNYDFVYSDSVGSSGGILCIWEASVFKKDYATISDNFVAIYGTWLPCNAKVLIVNIYALQQPSCKRILWEYILNLLGRWNGEAIVMGDFNEVRSKDERLGSVFNHFSARHFDHFITSSGLVDVNLEGYSFTWLHPSASKMSKLDRFLVTEGILLLYPSITALCLDRHLSDHRPILLREVNTDFGPTPFRFYHSWFSLDGFDDMVEQAWLSFSHSDSNGMIRFKKKLQDLKLIIRRWFGICARWSCSCQHWSDLSSLVGSVSLSSSKDRWSCDLTGDGEFKVKVVRNSLDDLFLPSQPDATRWVKYIQLRLMSLLGVLVVIVTDERYHLCRRCVAVMRLYVLFCDSDVRGH
ncbi:RNA-directed DNA polymerase, eukaryota [Tanacetum coccineum]